MKTLTCKIENETYKVTLEKEKYYNNGRLAIILNYKGDYFTDLTTNISECALTNNKCAFVDTFNKRWAMSFIRANKLGHPTGRIAQSGFNTYLEIEFNI